MSLPSHIVVGAGAIGAAAAYWLARRGADHVVVLERHGLVNTLGSSGDHSRIIRHAYHSQTYTSLTPAMFETWAEIEDLTGMRLYTQTGGLDLARAGTPGAGEVDAYRRALVAQDLPYEDLTGAEIRRRYPQWRLDEDVIGLYQEAGGLLDIRRSVSAHTALAMSHGVEFRTGEEVRGVTLHDDSVTVHTAAGSMRAGALVIAAGSWLPELTNDLGLRFTLTLSQEQVGYFVPDDLLRFAPSRFPIWLYHGEEAGEFYGFPVYGEAAVKLGRDMRGAFIDLEQRRLEPDDQEPPVLQGFLERHLPSASWSYLSGRTCVYDLTPDRDFVLDTIEGHPHVAVFTGGGHAGKFSSLVGQILADLLISGATRHPIAPFRLDRPALTDPEFPPVFASRAVADPRTC